MSLDAVVEAIKTFPGVTRKNPIHTIVESFPINGFPHVAAAAGEDAAAIESGDEYILLATDGIMEALVNTNPFYAGYYAVLVNVNDIAAMGGRALAMMDVISLSKSTICNQILRGMALGVKKFNVPIVGGHTHPDSRYNAINISVMGKVPKDDIILSSEARDGDDIVFVIDLDGHYPEGMMHAWDTTMDKEPAEVQRQMDLLPRIAALHLVNSGKDMSNPGCIGTLGMMLESSCKGGTVDLDLIPRPEGVDLIRWVLSYQGCGFVFACPPENSDEVIRLFAEVGCTGAVVGSVNPGRKLKLVRGGESRVLFDFETEIISGCVPIRR